MKIGGFTKRVQVERDKITEQLSHMFDYEFNGETTFEVPSFELPNDFNIGLIVGPSGSGKSTLLSCIGEAENLEWNGAKSIASHFDNHDQAADKLASTGLNDVRAWVKPFHVLSNGQQHRAEMARRIKDNAVIDEFTSVVDRNVAKSMAYAMCRYIRKNNIKNVVLASCHYDIIEWLNPDWVLNTEDNTLKRRSLRKPTVRLEIIPCRREIWYKFAPHHYLNAELNNASYTWMVLWENTLVGFASALAFPHPTLQNVWRGHRLVVLPEFQGLGIGVRIQDSIGELFLKQGKRYMCKTAHPRLGGYRDNSPLWRPTTQNHTVRTDYLTRGERYAEKGRKNMKLENLERHATRFTYCHEYMGSKQSEHRENGFTVKIGDKIHFSAEIEKPVSVFDLFGG